MVDYNYLKQWLSREQLQRIRAGDNPMGVVLSRRQVLNIMKGTSKNFSFRNHLVSVARQNEALNTATTQN